MVVWLFIGYKMYCSNKSNIGQLESFKESFRDPLGGQVQTILSCLLQKGVCKETTGITKRGMPSMRSMLLFRFCLPRVNAATTLPYL